ncbi:hypothetical protein [Methanococcus aeolicus]|uniref:hypothetical protein n=1 Tax=Methanococcus aeolicus TaxID=42879 RepID=UPI0021C7AFF5|nr:hypothetical protein [Methanococcus aeolicus]UXM85026.1 hypothetical protein N6C89_01720 [Methanococcus aeolicus]
MDAENENTQFTIDGDNATNILSDGVISIKVDKSNIGNDDKIQVNTISVKVEYINNTNSGSGTTTKTPIPFNIVLLLLVIIPYIALKMGKY